MNTLTIFKIILAPILIWAVSWAGRKWGPAVSGLLIGLPLNSGPVALFVALQYGASFARQTTDGILLGIVSIVVFGLVYGWLAAWRLPWPLVMVVSWLANILSTLALDQIHASVLVAYIAAFVSIILFIVLLPPAPKLGQPSAAPWWDIPARMLVATAFLFALTAAAPTLGSQLSGLLATLPIFTSILAGFNHHLYGPSAAIRFMRGFSVGLFGFLSFFAVLELLLTSAPLWLAFVIATLAALAAQAVIAGVSRYRAARPYPAPTSPQPLS